MNPDYFTIKNFRFQNGKILPELVIEYSTWGTRKTDSHGNITNGILYLHGGTGNYSSVEKLTDIIGPNRALDSNQYFIISPTALGFPGSSSPSTSGLGPEFPEYTIYDMFRAHYQFVTQHLRIEHLKGIMGTSMGGFLALTWAVEYPNFTDFLILNATTYRISNRMYGVYHLMNQIIREDPEYNCGNYTKNPLKAMERSSLLTFLWTLSSYYYEDCFKTRREFLQAIDDMKNDSHEIDANDILWRNHALLKYDLEGMITNVTAPTLIIGVRQDELIPEKTGHVLSDMIPDSELFIFDSVLGHYGCVKDIGKASRAISMFLENLNI